MNIGPQTFGYCGYEMLMDPVGGFVQEACKWVGEAQYWTVNTEDLEGCEPDEWLENISDQLSTLIEVEQDDEGNWREVTA
jgi:hypothetical protein